MATRCRCPPDSEAGLLSSSVCSCSVLAISVDPLGPLGLALSGELHREGDVVEDGHVRIERVALKDHGDVAVLRGKVLDVLAADAQGAAADLLQPGDHPQGRRLAAARWPDEDQELAVVARSGSDP